MSGTDEHLRWMLSRRGVDTPCDRCQGLGVRMYSSGSTWMGGMGTASCERDICDACWGSGDASRPWLDLRTLEADMAQRASLMAGDMFARRCGVWLTSLLPALDELCTELDKFERQRRPRPSGFDTVTRCLAGLLRELVAAKRAEVSK